MRATPVARRAGLRARHREALACGALTALALLVFTLWPQIDLAVSHAFYAGAGDFPWQRQAWVVAVYRGTPWVGWSLAVAGAVMLLAARFRPAAVPHRWRQRAASMLACMLIGVVGVVHGVLKDHWGRPRPAQLTEFGGAQPFSPVLQPLLGKRAVPPAGQHNESFVSGHAATGYALLAVGLFGAPATRRRWRAVGLAAGALVSLVRVAQGGHFLSDVLFAGLAVWATCLVIREVGLRLGARRRQPGTP